MPAEFRLTVRFLEPYFHGRGEDGASEWPPSPLRLFQALTATSVGRAPDAAHRDRAIAALLWLEGLRPPEIVAPLAAPVSAPLRLYVPDNVGDRVAASWSAGNDASLADHRTEKDVCPVRLAGDTLHYVFRNVDGLDEDRFRQLQAMVRTITHLGWGIDLVAGDADRAVGGIDGERWIPGRAGGRHLRCPAPGTFADLERKHRQFLGRLETGTFRPVAPLARFDLVPFARATEGAPPPYVAFRLLEPTTGDHLWLDPPRRTRDVAAWVRHATADVSEGWPFGSTSLLVHGHRETSGSNEGDSARLFFLPLPTINPRLGRVEGITRVMVVGRPGLEEQLAWIGSRLAGYQVEWQGEPVAMLEPLATGDWVLGRYLGSGLTWSSVTPVVLPGHDDRSGSKAERLLRKALLQAGLEPELVDGIRDLDWRKAGFWKGTALASRYLPPDKVSGPMFHVRLRFSKPVVGPLALGSGRFRGMGVFARD